MSERRMSSTRTFSSRLSHLAAVVFVMAAVLVAVATPIAARAVVAPLTWEGPWLVTSDPAQEHGFDPAIVETAAGDYFALMAGRVGSNRGLFLLHSADGMSWGTPRYVTTGWDECDIIQGQDGFLYAMITRASAVQVWRADADGTGWVQWGQIVSNQPAVPNQFWGSTITQASDGTFYAAFTDHLGGEHSVLVSSSVDAESWTAPVRLTKPGRGHAFDASIVEIDGVLYVVYNSHFNRGVWLSKSSDGGDSFSAPVALTGGGVTSAHSGPTITEDVNGDIVVAYSGRGLGLALLLSTDGTNWEASSTGLDGYAPSLISDSAGDLWMIFAVHENNQWRVYTAAATTPIRSISATIDFRPDTLALQSNGRWVSVFIELPMGNDPADIDIGTVSLNGEVRADLSRWTIGDEDGNGLPDLTVKFSRRAVQAIVAPGIDVPIDVEGSLADGRVFAGTDLVRVKLRGTRGPAG